MKTLHLFPLVLAFLFPMLASAQVRIDANEIIAKINKGQAVTYTNAVIHGVFDLTQLSNKTWINKRKNAEKDAQKVYVSTVEVPLFFKNCTFEDAVLGYYNPDNESWLSTKKNELFNTNFNEKIVFENCVFKKEVALKYSEFKGSVSFAGSKFREHAVFKYSVFSQGPDFSKAEFNDGVEFKYVKFPGETTFAQSIFLEDADFKYATFSKGADFTSARFSGMANFKYAKFREPFSMKSTDFSGSTDFKYTQLNGARYSPSH